MSGKKEYVPARGGRRLFHLRYQGREALRRHGHGVHVAAHLHVDGNGGLLFIVKYDDGAPGRVGKGHGIGLGGQPPGLLIGISFFRVWKAFKYICFTYSIISCSFSRLCRSSLDGIHEKYRCFRAIWSK